MLHPLLELPAIKQTVLPNVLTPTAAAPLLVLTYVVITVGELLLAITMLQEVLEFAPIDRP